jgi:para-aminobenzoate synthetase component I
MSRELDILESLLFQIEQSEVGCLLFSNSFDDPYGEYNVLMGSGEKRRFVQPSELTGFEGLALGHIAYSYKNRVYQNLNGEQDHLNSDYRWPHFYFFEPEQYYIHPRNGQIESNFKLSNNGAYTQVKGDEKIEWHCTDSKQDYLRKIEEIRNCIVNGVFYEMNFCVEFQSSLNLNPYVLFMELIQSSPAPFCCFYKLGDRFMIGGSPERFLAKRGLKLIIQPIKGTSKRTGNADIQERQSLANSAKDRAENIMIVDLVRNDLSRVSKVGSVKVEELCGIYTFPNVHQMISTVISEVSDDACFDNILEATFPMGSMTGAPKIEVMKHIDRLESFKRNLYSGSIGYWNNGDFDLNVVIRSLEKVGESLFHSVGGAITYDSIAADEYDECLTKAQSIRKLI